MKFRLIYEETARADILETTRYYGVVSTDLRRRFQAAFRKTIFYILQNPMQGQHFMSDDPLLSVIRSFQIDGFEKFRIYYRLRDKDILIRRVLHGARDLSSLLY